MENDIKDIKEKIERWKIKAEALKISKNKAFIKDIHDTWYFCEIISWDDAILQVRIFKGKRMDMIDDIFWCDIKSLEKYKEARQW